MYRNKNLNLNVPLGPVVGAILLIAIMTGSLVLVSVTKSSLEIALGLKTAKNHMGTIAPAMSVILYMSPFTPAKNAVKQNNKNLLPVAAFVSQAVCNVVSIVYGLKIDEMSVWTPNLFGLGCQILWLALYHALAQQPSFTDWIPYSIKMSTVVFFGFFILIFMPTDMVGIASMVGNVVLVLSPLTKITRVLETRCSDALPFGLVFMLCFTNFFWSLYGWYIQDDVVFLPSLLGYGLGIFELIVIAWCHRKLPFELHFLLAMLRREFKHREPANNLDLELDPLEKIQVE